MFIVSSRRSARRRDSRQQYAYAAHEACAEQIEKGRGDGKQFA